MFFKGSPRHFVAGVARRNGTDVEPMFVVKVPTLRVG